MGRRGRAPVGAVGVAVEAAGPALGAVGACGAGDVETGGAGVGAPVGVMVAGGAVAGDTFEAGMVSVGLGIGPTRDARPVPGSREGAVPMWAEMDVAASVGAGTGLSGVGPAAGAKSAVGPSSL